MMKNKKIVVIIQARMGSTRLPGKVLMDINGKPLLWHVIERIKRCRKIHSVVVATTDQDKDRVIVDLVRKRGTAVFTGDEKDVLSRFYHAAKKYGADIVARVTADCPLVDPRRIDEAVTALIDQDYDYINPDRNFSGLPPGIRAEVFTFRVLEEAYKNARDPYDREHVTLYALRNRHMFKCGWLEGNKRFQNSSIRLDVDDEQGLEFIRSIYDSLYKEGQIIELRDVFDLLDKKRLPG